MWQKYKFEKRFKNNKFDSEPCDVASIEFHLMQKQKNVLSLKLKIAIKWIRDEKNI